MFEDKRSFENKEEALAAMIKQKLFAKSDEKYIRVEECKNAPGKYNFTIDKKYYRQKKDLIDIAKFLIFFQSVLKLKWRIIDYIDPYIERYFKN